MEIEVDLPLARLGGAAALDVHDVGAVEDREVDRVPRLVAQPPQVWAEISRTSIELIAEKPRSSTLGPSR